MLTVETNSKEIKMESSSGKANDMYTLPVAQQKYFYSCFNAESAVDFGPHIQSHFPGFKNYELELGAGKGDFLVDFCQKNPEIVLVAVEKKWQRCKVLTSKIMRHGLTNAFIIQGMIEQVLDQGFQPLLFDRVYMNYPDPWPKKRHNRRRTAGKELFLDHLHRCMHPGGLFTFVTDYREYALQTLDLIKSHSGYVNALEGEIAHSLPNYHSTLFERYALKDGIKPNYIQFKTINPSIT